MAFFKKAAVFSDNSYMLSQFLSIASDKNVDCYCSIYSDPGAFAPNVVKKIDIKKEYRFLLETYDLIFSMHCKQIFPAELVQNVKCINLHPGYNPINRGWYPQVFSIIKKIDTGATLHEMDEKLDHGRIIDRKKVAVESSDTSASLYEKIVAAELDLLRKNLDSVFDNSYSAFYPENEGNVFLKKDFNELCEINLQKEASYQEVIEHLRALSHNNFRNAYFIDPVSKQKIYIKLELSAE
nr:dTDP-4-amino-4,6-dideoxyglucose formyltransferase [uncultured Desulfobacter sp.]